MGDTGSTTKSRWTTGLVIVSIVASGVIVAGLTQPHEELQLTTAPTTPTAEPEAPMMPEYVRITEPADPTAAIPGCDIVETPGEPILSMSTSMTESTYDNPKFPWFSGPKATAMSDAVIDLLPTGVEVAFASPQGSLRFGPIMDFDESDPNSIGSTDAWGTVSRAGAAGTVHVSVRQSTQPIPACFAGALDERVTAPDGTVLDLNDMWEEVNGVRTVSRSVAAYVPDGSWIDVTADDRPSTPETSNSGQIPLSLDELQRIALDPRLRSTAPVPPGTAPPAPDCGVYTDVPGPDITREERDRLNDVLAGADLGGIVLDRPLNTLQLTDFGMDILCSSSTVVGTNTSLGLTLVGGQELPREDAERPDPFSDTRKTFRTLEDGTVVQTDLSSYASVSSDGSEDAEQRVSNSVTVTRPGGTRVSMTSSSAVTSEPVRLEILETVALTDGLEIR
ncbi:hypothetical protein AB0362_06740 [Rhodococcus sp. NPDC079359]|uniref:hypothetical protein n=1 Tax=Rhodococcus sp. NPDC079359 TaxID=3154961 RepID=UPI00344EC40F